MLERRAAILHRLSELVQASGCERAAAATWLVDCCREDQGTFDRSRLADVVRWAVLFWRAAAAATAGVSPPLAMAEVADSSRAAALRVGAAGARQALAALVQASIGSGRLSELATVDALCWALP
jgi:hypothetical protein